MPLYMDFHIIPDVTIEEVKNAHVADKSVQHKYGVKYHQFWVNEEAGSVFCLMEGPDKESCAATHREAHGNVACEIVEVEMGMYSMFMGENSKTDHGVVLHEDGAVDTGHRFVLTVNIIGNTHITTAFDYKELLLPAPPKNLVITKVSKYQGKEVRHPGDDSIIAVFQTPDNALYCAVDIQRTLRISTNNPNEPEWDITFKMGISGSPPLTVSDGFFDQAIKVSKRLSLIASNEEIMVSPIVEKLCDYKTKTGPLQNNFVRVLGSSEDKFLKRLFDITENKISEDHYTIQNLGRDIGISRPNLYRKVVSSTGRTPIEFVRELKMNKALSLLQENQFNVSEIALKVGYNNPSYFAKCFKEKYGITPSKVNS